jgi:uncharacterized protein YfkK (UPF0435 family)
MKGHLYRISIEHLEDAKSNAVNADPLVFEARNHDDLFDIVRKIQGRNQFSQDEAAAFAIGLKLFSEVMLHNKDHALFREFLPQFGEFMKNLKKG